MAIHTVQIIYPHQLFRPEYIDKEIPVYIIEEQLFFKQFKFHKQKIAFHIATMSAYRDDLVSKGFHVNYVDSNKEESDTNQLLSVLKRKGVEMIKLFPVTDDWLMRRLNRSGLTIEYLNNPQFLLQSSDIKYFFQSSRKKYLHAQFYQNMRKRENILLENGQPKGGKWSFDEDNRKKYKKGEQVPFINFPPINDYWKQSITRVEKEFPDNYGHLSQVVNYPVTRSEAVLWLEQFFEIRFHQFGKYEDAILRSGVFNHHSVLSLLINNGLLEPKQVIKKSLIYAKQNCVPINSLEGFIRQIIGWREFVRGIYEVHGRKQRSTNFLNLDNKLPNSFYSGTTGIKPIDETIQKVLNNAYCHHIERLMVLGNFMLLCEVHPDEVYQWFMELFIDAYDWVMVPNVYGMSQFADGGLFATKPYICSSSYIIKMSDYQKGDWSDIWDALYWRFVNKYSNLFEKNPRSKLILNNWNNKTYKQKEVLINTAEKWLKETGF